MKLNQTESPNIKRVDDFAGHPDFLWRKPGGSISVAARFRRGDLIR
jgi:hypothetical protein